MEIPIKTDDKPTDVWLLNDNTGHYLKKEYITRKNFLTCLNKRHMFVVYIQQKNEKYYDSILPRKIIKYIVNIKMLLKCLE